MAVTVAVAVAAATSVAPVVAVIAVAPLMTVVAAVAIAPAAAHFAVARRIRVGVPLVAHEIHLAPARVVARAMLAPFFHVPRRHAQIHRLGRAARIPFHHDRLGVHHRRPAEIGGIDASIKSRLPDVDTDIDLGLRRQAGAQQDGGDE
ncbi:hypothetical protein F2P45_00655 [Massilia sp. CCM 8733]|uniref:Secreted peptide n=1 Tax=Massilia mucilaginosa TaxID=2609282 RepID=A0ABX0NL69_9BURK|nr:hypothetical protein [Massilia mucilaginosa]